MIQIAIKFILLLLISSIPVNKSNFTGLGDAVPLQTNLQEPGLWPATSQPVNQEETVFLTIPLKRAGNLIIVESVVNGITGNLILDTGSSRLVLNSIYFREKQQQRNQVSGGITGSIGVVSQKEGNKLQLSDLVYEDLTADVTDLGHIEQARNMKILGLFGLSMLAGYEVVIDLQLNQLELHKLDFYGNWLGQTGRPKQFDLEVPIVVNGDLLFMEGHIAGKRCTFCLDTGAETNVLSNDLPDKMMNTLTVLRRTKLRGTGSQSTEALYCVMNDFSIARHPLPGMNVLVTNLSHMKKAYGVYIDGMLGCDFFEKGIVFINTQKGKLAINFAGGKE